MSPDIVKRRNWGECWGKTEFVCQRERGRERERERERERNKKVENGYGKRIRLDYIIVQQIYILSLLETSNINSRNTLQTTNMYT